MPSYTRLTMDTSVYTPPKVLKVSCSPKQVDVCHIFPIHASMTALELSCLSLILMLRGDNYLNLPILVFSF